jgi:hypothetical protein
MRELVERSSHNDAWHDANLIHAHIRTLLFPFACSPPRSWLGVKFFYFLAQEFLQRRLNSFSPIQVRHKQHTTRFSNSAFSKMEYGAGGFGGCLSPTTVKNAWIPKQRMRGQAGAPGFKMTNWPKAAWMKTSFMSSWFRL